MRLLVLFLLLSLGGQAQIIRAQPFYVPSGCSGLLLDCYPNAAVAYSLRKLKSSYSGSAIRIRRDSTGNAETDIGFTANGDLDTNAIKTHCRNNTCAVVTWYNQGDSTYNATLASTTQQPVIAINGIIQRSNGKPSIYFASGKFLNIPNYMNWLHNGTTISSLFFCCHIGTTSNPNTLYALFATAQSLNIAIGYGLRYDDRSASGKQNNLENTISPNVTNNVTDSNYITPNKLLLISNLINPSNSTASDRSEIYLNNGTAIKNNTLTTTPSTGNSTATPYIGRNGTTATFFVGYFSEIIIYPSNKSLTRSDINTNINNYYGLW